MKSRHLLLLLLTMSMDFAYGQAPGWLWAKNAVGRQNDQSYTVTTDGSGNVFVAGFFSSDSILFGGVTLHNNGVGNQDMFLAKYDGNGNLQWVRSAGGSDDDKAFSVVTDAAGNVFLVGYFYSPTIIFGTDTLSNAGFSGDIFIVKYDNAGNIMWVKREGGPSLEIPYAVTLDPFGNIFVAGRFSSTTITFGTITLIQAGSMDVFLVKYDPAGNVIWARGAGGGSNDEAYALSTDASGNIWVAGYFNQTISIGTTSLVSAGSADMFVAKYDSAGTLQWAKRAGGSGDDRAKTITTDGLGNTYAAGFFISTSITFGGVTLNNSGGDNSFLVKYDDAGNVRWAQNVNGDSRAQGAVVRGTQLYICGGFSGDTLTYGPSVLLLSGTSDFFVLNCDTAGNAHWAVKQTSGGASGDFGNAIASDAGGHVYTAGFFDSDPFTLGSTTLSNTGTSFDMFVARLGTTVSATADLPKEDAFLIYPNPADKQFIIHPRRQPVSQIADTKTGLYNYLGELVFECACFYEEDEIIDVSLLPAGYYLLRINYGDRSYSTGLIIQ